MAEEYFSAHAGVSVTSDHTLSRLAIPQMDQQQVNKALDSAPSSHHKEIQDLYEEYQGLFNKWMFQLRLVVYSFGFFGTKGVHIIVIWGNFQVSEGESCICNDGCKSGFILNFSVYVSVTRSNLDRI